MPLERLSEQIAKLEDRLLSKTQRWRARHPGDWRLYAVLGGVAWYFYGMVINSVRFGTRQSFQPDSGITDIWTVNPVLNLIAPFTPTGLGVSAALLTLVLLCSKKARNWLLGYHAVHDKRGFDILPDGTHDSALVRDLNFTVSAGDYLCILGENGAGKSTLMKTILGLLTPLEGSVTLSGGVRANEIGYLPQQTQAQRDFPATVWEVALSGCQSRCGLCPFYTKAEKELARDSLRHMDMERFSKRCYRELSGGQQQRVLLARALCAARKMLLLDEPVAGLDLAASRELYQVIAQLNQKDGMTILMISHDVEAALRYASHILYLGEHVFFGTRDAFVRSNPGRGFLEQRGGGDHGTAD